MYEARWKPSLLDGSEFMQRSYVYIFWFKGRPEIQIRVKTCLHLPLKTSESNDVYILMLGNSFEQCYAAMIYAESPDFTGLGDQT